MANNSANYNVNMRFTADTGQAKQQLRDLQSSLDTTRFNPTKKVLAAIQIIEEITDASMYRTQTIHDSKHDSYFDI